MNLFHSILNKINSILLPVEYCALCNCSCKNQICSDCRLSLLQKSQVERCWKCQIIKPPKQLVCNNCTENSFIFDRIVSAFDYISPLDKILHLVKYQHKLNYISLINDLFYQRISGQITHLPDIIIPIPLHKNKHNLRGFNQTQELSNIFLQKHRNIRQVDAIRFKETKQQATLNRYSRIVNMHKAFNIAEDLTDKSVAIIDDVITTGTTVTEMARLCKNLGATKVEIWCLMRAQN